MKSTELPTAILQLLRHLRDREASLNLLVGLDERHAVARFEHAIERVVLEILLDESLAALEGQLRQLDGQRLGDPPGAGAARRRSPGRWRCAAGLAVSSSAGCMRAESTFVLGCWPRALMSSVKPVRRISCCVILRCETNVPRPCSRKKTPSLTRSVIACRVVMRLMPYCSLNSRSEGIRSPALPLAR